MTPDWTLTRSEDVMAREISGEMVLMHLGSGTYFGLNPVGSRVWTLLEYGPRTIGEIAAKLEQEFDAPLARIEEDVLALAGELTRHELVDARAD